MKRSTFLTVAVMLAAGCQSVVGTVAHVKPDYSELPAEAVRAAAEQIERDVIAGRRDADLPAVQGLSLDSAAVKQAVRTRAARAELVNQLLDAGYAWEKGNGHIYLRPNGAYKKATTRQQRDRNAMIVAGETNDRWAIYEGIMEANHLSPGALSAVQKLFFEARTQVMRDGQQYEAASGEVAVKGQR